MFTIKYKDLRAEATIAAMRKLTNCTELPYKAAYNVMRMSKVINQELNDSQKQWVALCAKYCDQEVVPGGKRIKMTEEGEPKWLDGVDVEAAKKAFEDFHEKEVIIKREVINIEDIAAAKLSPSDMFAIDFMLKGE